MFWVLEIHLLKQVEFLFSQRDRMLGLVFWSSANGPLPPCLRGDGSLQWHTPCSRPRRGDNCRGQTPCHPSASTLALRRCPGFFPHGLLLWLPLEPCFLPPSPASLWARGPLSASLQTAECVCSCAVAALAALCSSET